MSTRTRRVLFTAMYAALPYIAWCVVVWDVVNLADARPEERFCWLIASAFFGGMCWTYPGWQWAAQQRGEERAADDDPGQEASAASVPSKRQKIPKTGMMITAIPTME